MALTLPTKFEADLQGRENALVPIVVITHTSGIATLTEYVSTSSIVLEGVQYKPILLNIPALKESLDIEKRNYKISSINLNLSNFPFEGVRFSEVVSNASLNNARVDIYWITPSGIGLGDALLIYSGNIRKYTHDDTQVKLVVEDKSQSVLHRDLPNTNVGDGENIPEKGKNRYVPIVYGEVERSPLVAHRSFTEIVGEGDEEEENVLEYRLKADTEDVDFLATEETISIGTASHTISALYFFDNGSYHNVNRFSNNVGEAAGDENFRYGNTDIILDVDTGSYGQGGDELDNDFSKGHLRLHAIRKFNKIDSVYMNNSGVTGYGGNLIIDNTVAGIGRIYGKVNCSVGNATGIEYTDWTSGHFKCYFEPLTIPSNLSVDEDGNIEKPKTFLLINATHYNFYNTGQISPDPFTPNVSNQFSSSSTDPQVSSGVPITHWAIFRNSTQMLWWGQGSDYDSNGFWGASWNEYGVHFVPLTFNNITTDVIGGSTFYGRNIDDIFWFDTLTSYDYINIGIPAFRWDVNNVGNLTSADDRDWGVDTTIHEAFIVQTYKVMGITDKDYYASVRGRFHPDGHSHAQNIIIDIMEKELDTTVSLSPDPATYNELFWYDFGKYAFTVAEKINSKKLIEELASVSPFIPRFNNMGEFKLDIIKDQYWYAEVGHETSYTPYTEIKADDVISNSFSRTSINDVCTKVVFKYGWDYAEEKFNKSVAFQIGQNTDGSTQIDSHFWSSDGLTYDHNYYGLPEDDTESTLVIDDERGKYIRDTETATKYAQWMLRLHCNQHLKIKVRMPLKYMYIEIGDILRFDKMIGDVKPYGISYDKEAEFFMGDIVYAYYGFLVNGQQAFPDFMCISTNKTLEYCEIECIQMHNLSNNPRLTKQIHGCMDVNAWNFNPLAEVDDGTCLIPPDNGIGANQAFRDFFLRNDCPWLVHESQEMYYYNYPHPEHSVFDDPNLDWGEDLVDTNNPFPPPDRYDYNNNNHMAAAGAWFREGFDPETNTSTNIPQVYSQSNCHTADIQEYYIQLTLSLFGLQWGYAGDTEPSPNPDNISTVLSTQPGWNTYSPIYNQYTTWAYSGVPTNYNWFFHYIPFPLWHPSGIAEASVMNDALATAWIMDGMDDPLGNPYMKLQIDSLLMAGVVYDDAGDYLYSNYTFEFKKMTISVEPIGYFFNPGTVENEWGTPNYQYDVVPITSNTLEFDSIPNKFETHSLYIRGFDYRHSPPSPDTTTQVHMGDIWTVHVRVIIENEFAEESNVVLRIRYGQTTQGGPSSIAPGGWGNANP